MQLLITIDADQAAQAQKALQALPLGYGKAATSAINRTVMIARTRASRRIAAIVGIKYKDARSHVWIIRARQAGPFLQGGLEINAGKVSLYKLGAREKKPAGVHFAVAGQTYNLPHGFQATMPQSGHKGIFQRLNLIPAGAKRRGGVKGIRTDAFRRDNLPIDEGYGPPMSEIYHQDPALIEAEIAAMNIDLSRNLAGQVNRLLKTAKGDAGFFSFDDTGDDTGDADS